MRILMAFNLGFSIRDSGKNPIGIVILQITYTKERVWLMKD